MKNWYRELEARYRLFDEHIQILHVVSDLQKAKHYFKINRQTAINHCYRAIILLDYLIADKKWEAKRRELLRIREAVGSLTTAGTPYGSIEQIIRVTLQLNPRAYQMVRKMA